MAQNFLLIFLCVWQFAGVFGVDGDEVKSVSVTEGDSVTLHTEIQRDDQIVWRFGPEDTRITGVIKSSKDISASEGLKERLKLEKTGSLIIRNITKEDSGVYKAQIIGNKVSRKTFNVTVYARLPVPVIIRYCPLNPLLAERSNCSLLCSVLNMRDVSLSWYKGNSLLSSISVSDLNIRLSLPLEVEYQDTNTYRCVVNNTITNQTQHLNINDLCQMCPDYENSCETSEAVIRLVVSALMGVAAAAAVVVLIYDIRSRRAEQTRGLYHEAGLVG
nr:carcinoembryonic antigen-related cell adhesion molecule 8-like [Misgurnus anguillicaudatus]